MDASLLNIITLSLEVSLSATAVVMVFSILLALWLVASRSLLAKIVEITVYLPMAMPPVALGYGMLLLVGNNAPLGRFLHDYLGIDVAFTFLGAVLAAVMVSLGIGVRTMRLALEAVERAQIDNAYLLGAHKFQIFFYIVLPQCSKAILAGAVLVFIRALSEFGATMVLAGNNLGGIRTLAVAIWVGMEVPGHERQSLILLLIAVGIAVVALGAVDMLSPKSRP